MARRGSSARAAALRRAQEAKAARDAARLRREKDIEAALADYFEATDQAERIRSEARRKADRLLADAEQAAEAPRQTSSAAVRRLRELVGTATEVASLCGISSSEVRAVLAKPVPRSQPGGSATEPSDDESAPGASMEHRRAEPAPPPATPSGNAFQPETAAVAGDEEHE